MTLTTKAILKKYILRVVMDSDAAEIDFISSDSLEEGIEAYNLFVRRNVNFKRARLVHFVIVEEEISVTEH